MLFTLPGKLVDFNFSKKLVKTHSPSKVLAIYRYKIAVQTTNK